MTPEPSPCWRGGAELAVGHLAAELVAEEAAPERIIKAEPVGRRRRCWPWPVTTILTTPGATFFTIGAKLVYGPPSRGTGFSSSGHVDLRGGRLCLAGVRVADRQSGARHQGRHAQGQRNQSKRCIRVEMLLHKCCLNSIYVYTYLSAGTVTGSFPGHYIFVRMRRRATERRGLNCSLSFMEHNSIIGSIPWPVAVATAIWFGVMAYKAGKNCVAVGDRRRVAGAGCHHHRFGSGAGYLHTVFHRRDRPVPPQSGGIGHLPCPLHRVALYGHPAPSPSCRLETQPRATPAGSAGQACDTRSQAIAAGPGFSIFQNRRWRSRAAKAPF